MVVTQTIMKNHFGYIFGTTRYNTKYIPTTSIPFSYGRMNLTSQFSSSIPMTNTNPSVGLGSMVSLHIPLSFGGAHIPQENPTVGSQPPFQPGSNPSRNAPRWSNQLDRQDVTYVPSFTPTSSTFIPTNNFIMTNPPLSSGFPPRGGQFHTLGNPQPGATLARGNIYDPHYKIPTGMVPNQPLMNFFVGGFYNPGQGHGAYQNPRWARIPQQQPFPRVWDHMPQPGIPFLATLNFPNLSMLMNDLECHDPSWPPVPTKLPSDILKFKGNNGEDLGDHVTTFHLWCSSNSLNDDFIHLRLFQRTLMGVGVK
jgi:hypothetical protein